MAARRYGFLMPSIHDDPAALKALQDDIYREKILRARRLTPEQRLADALELTNGVFARMLEGVMWQTGSNDVEQGWKEVRRRVSRICQVHDEGRFVNQRPDSV